MNYGASIRDFFASPRWGMNLLLGGVCMLIPLIGPLVLTGWLVTVFWTDENASKAPSDFDFNELGKYLERGLWPSLAVFVVSLVSMPIAWVIVFVPVFGSTMLASASRESSSGCLVAIAAMVMLALLLLYFIAISLLVTPLKLRATLTQSFARTFDFRWVKQFVKLMWKEVLVSWLFLLAVNLLFMIVGCLLLCVGIYFAMVPVYFAWIHLSKQLYQIFLTRGGEPVRISDKLTTA